SLSRVKLSANWMAACGAEGQDAALYEAVRAVGEDLCPALELTIPVGKDSMSMRTMCDDGRKSVVAPVSLIVSAFGRVRDVRDSVTPDFKKVADSALIFVDLGRGRNRMGLSAYAQVTGQIGSEVPDVDSPADLKAFFEVVQKLLSEKALLAYHDRSDGGLFATLVEMCFAGKVGAMIDLAAISALPQADAPVARLFSEELGALIQVTSEKVDQVLAQFEKVGLGDVAKIVGKLRADDRIVVTQGSVEIL